MPHIAFVVHYYKSYLHISTNGVQSISLSCPFIGYINTISIEDPPIGQGANSVITFTLITDPSDVGLFKINSTTVSKQSSPSS